MMMTIIILWGVPCAWSWRWNITRNVSIIKIRTARCLTSTRSLMTLKKILEFLQAKSKIYFNFYREKLKTSYILKTFEFLVRTLRKTTIPITIALKKKTMTTPSPVARAGWLDKDDKNVLLSGQKSPEQSCSWKSLPEHNAPPLAGGGFVQVRSWRWKQDSKQWPQAPHVDHPWKKN